MRSAQSRVSGNFGVHLCPYQCDREPERLKIFTGGQKRSMICWDLRAIFPMLQLLVATCP